MKGVNWYTIQKSGHMVLQGINWVNNDKIRSYGLERSQLGTQCKNQVIWSWKESIGYTMIKLGQMVLKGVTWVHKTAVFVDFNRKLWFLWILAKTVVFRKSAKTAVFCETKDHLPKKVTPIFFSPSCQRLIIQPCLGLLLFARAPLWSNLIVYRKGDCGAPHEKGQICAHKCSRVGLVMVRGGK